MKNKSKKTKCDPSLNPVEQMEADEERLLGELGLLGDSRRQFLGRIAASGLGVPAVQQIAGQEGSRYDTRFGNPVQRSLADYHVPVNLDVPEIDVHFINKPDPHISATGVRGVGEIGGIGVSAAIANAIFNATGKRGRDLPITLNKLL